MAAKKSQIMSLRPLCLTASMSCMCLYVVWSWCRVPCFLQNQTVLLWGHLSKQHCSRKTGVQPWPTKPNPLSIQNNDTTKNITLAVYNYGNSCFFSFCFVLFFCGVRRLSRTQEWKFSKNLLECLYFFKKNRLKLDYYKKQLQDN